MKIDWAIHLSRGVVRNPKIERTNRTDPLWSEIFRTESKTETEIKNRNRNRLISGRFGPGSGFPDLDRIKPKLSVQKKRDKTLLPLVLYLLSQKSKKQKPNPSLSLISHPQSSFLLSKFHAAAAQLLPSVPLASALQAPASRIPLSSLSDCNTASRLTSPASR